MTEEERINYKDLDKECHPRDDPNGEYVEDMFGHEVKWVKEHASAYGGDVNGRTIVCCLTGKKCMELSENSCYGCTTFNDCRVCAIPNYECMKTNRDTLLYKICHKKEVQ